MLASSSHPSANKWMETLLAHDLFMIFRVCGIDHTSQELIEGACHNCNHVYQQRKRRKSNMVDGFIFSIFPVRS